ncbi:protein U62 [Proboscivirus elephantidbeta4]|uniref:Protein U62 n=1 Tax=Elephant endotheliotropic herpesvirus 4 TaxID=548914 RepID=A0A0S1TKS9_9BETA|nr:protein U62 [Elephant endotheliotropic herpesvirus 4]ALM26011.1 protein U62 [Elephant endotheliotropic herpesvirus 4]
MNTLIQNLRQFNVAIKNHEDFVKFLNTSKVGFGFISQNVSVVRETEELGALFDSLGLECLLDIKRAAGDLDGDLLGVHPQHDDGSKPTDV